MAVSMRNLDPAFHTLSHKAGLQIWRIQSRKPVLLSKNEHGRFYTQESYLVLRTKALRSGALHFDLHFWLGKETSEGDAEAAAVKAIELDAALGGRAVQYREVQGHETDLFLSYFKPCIIPVQGSAASGHEQGEDKKNKPCLYLCKGRRIARVQQVPFARSSLSHTNVFILETEAKVFQFNGESSSIQERARSLDVVQYIVDNNHGGKCEVIIIDDGRLGDETNTGQFWGLFGGFAPLSKKGAIEEDQSKSSVLKLFRIPAGGGGEELEVQAAGLRREILEGNKCYVLVCGYEMYVWIGRMTALDHRKAAALYAEKLIETELPGYTHMTKLIEGFETTAFRSKFDGWPHNAATAVAREGRGKITALLQQQSVVGTSPKKLGVPVKDEPLPVLDTQGKTEIWWVNRDSKTPLPPEEYGKFFSGDCYIVLHTAGHRKDEVFVYSWLGQHSSQNDQKVAVELSSKFAKELKGRAVLGRVHEGKEHAHFLAMLGPMIVLKGGHNAGSVERASGVEHDVLLFEVRGSGPNEVYAIQVDAVAGSLNSTKSFILQTESKIFIWHGSSTTSAQQKVALKVVEKLKPGTTSKILKEGSETPIFWKMLEGKRTRASIQESVDHEKDPRLFVCTSTEGNTTAFHWATRFIQLAGTMFSEILNFDQEDLLSDDVLILDTPFEVVTWVGQSCTSGQKANILSFGQRYVDHAIATEGLSPFTPLYQVSEGHEPPFFTRWFSWSAAKACALSDPYNMKLATLQGHPFQATKHNVRRVSGGGNVDRPVEDFDVSPSSSLDSSGGPSQRAAALAGLSQAMKTVDEGRKELVPRETGSTQRAAAMAALTSVWNSPSASKAVQGASSNAQTFQAELSPQKDGVLSLQPEPSTPKATSQRAAAVAALSSFLDSSPDQPLQGQPASGDWIVVSPDIHGGKTAALDTELVTGSENSEVAVKDEEFEDISSGESLDGFFSLSQLTVGSTNPASHIDATRRESYLRKDEFEQLFGMSREQFYALPQWKQALKKKQLDLF